MVLSTVAGICVVGAVFNYAPVIAAWHPPTIVASLGASAVLDYNTIRSPLAQPRNAIVGHMIAAIVGVAIAKAFMHTPEFFLHFDWVAAAIACAAASLAMGVTNTTHPPGGATAILACVDKQIIVMGWRYPPLMLIASLLMLGVALLFNNTLRQYPTWWWTPEEVGSKLPRSRKEKEPELEKKVDDSDLEAAELKREDSTDAPSSEETLTREFSHEIEFVEGVEAIQIAPYAIRMPHMELSVGETELLQALMMRLRNEDESH